MERQPGRARARTEGLVVRTLPDEVLVYQLARHRAHSLNRVAAAVWRQCDGTRTPAQIAERIRDTERLPMSEETVRYALARLARAGLLEASVADEGLSRRELIQRLGTAAAVALPVVTSIVAPTAAQAQSVVCVGIEAECTVDAQCCGAPGCTLPGQCFCGQGACSGNF